MSASRYSNRSGGLGQKSGQSRGPMPNQETVIAYVMSYGLKPEDNTPVSLGDGASDKPLIDVLREEISTALVMGASGVVVAFRKRVAGGAPIQSSTTVSIAPHLVTLPQPVSDGIKTYTREMVSPTVDTVYADLMAKMTPEQASVLNGKADGTAVTFQSTFQEDRIFVAPLTGVFDVQPKWDESGTPIVVFPVVQRDPPPNPNAQPTKFDRRTPRTLMTGMGKADPVKPGDIVFMDRCYLKDGTISMIYVNAGPTRAALESGNEVILPCLMVSVPSVAFKQGQEPVQQTWAFDNMNALELSSGAEAVDLTATIRERIKEAIDGLNQSPGTPAFQLIFRAVGPEDQMAEIASDPNSRASFSVSMTQKRAPGQENAKGADIKYVDPTVDDVFNDLMKTMAGDQNQQMKDVIEGKLAGWQVEYVNGTRARLSAFKTAGNKLNSSNYDMSKQFALWERNATTGKIEEVASGVAQGALHLIRINTDKPNERPIYWSKGVIMASNLVSHPADMITQNMHPAHMAESKKLAVENSLQRKAYYEEAKAGDANPSTRSAPRPDDDVPF
jgi:hypothetical protein